MVTHHRVVGAAVAVVLAWSVLPALPAQAADEGYTSFVAHTAAVDPSDNTVDSWSNDQVHVRQHNKGIVVWTDEVDGHRMRAAFATADGRPFVVGRAYFGVGTALEPSPEDGRMAVHRDGYACWDNHEFSSDGSFGIYHPMAGTFTFQELEHDASGEITRLRATYEVGCPTLVRAPGAEGSIAFNAAVPADPVPVPVALGPVTDLQATNVDARGDGSNLTTLTWTKPKGARDVIVDLVRSSDPGELPTKEVSGQPMSTGSYVTREPSDCMDTHTYRVIPRTRGGRLGVPSTLTVLGTRLRVSDDVQRIQVGEAMTFSGRLSVAEIGLAHPMDGPGIAGQRLELCRQPGPRIVGGPCELLSTATTRPDGSFTFRVRPGENTHYTVRVPAGPTILGNSSSARAVLVSPETDLTAPQGQDVTARVGAVRRGSVIRFSTSRSRAGSKGTVLLQRLDGRTWRTVKTARIATRGPRRMSIPYRESKVGAHRYRAVKPPGSRHVTGYSKVVRVQVR